ncbi:hypothetical protein [Phaeacidiphilus oryzae]|uniref:hypothetical protein n=1 Tax=Phaeacidiphilus oryzae TaxID=348818 RepID=UPI00055F58F0|nr:hypothetical protein [Phaeacidiphilus oryzae]
MPDELTLGELGRRLADMHGDLKEDIKTLSGRVDGKVSADVLALQQAAQDERHKALAERVTSMEAARAADARRIHETRRWLIAAVIIPILAIIIPLLATKGTL